MHVIQLADDEAIGRFDLEALRADPKAAIGESYISHESFSVWPKTDDVRKIRPKAETRHLMLVAEYRQVLGSGWYSTYDVPLERYETRGGASPPAGMKGDQVRIRGKALRCAPPPHQYDIDPKVARKKNRKQLDPSRIPTSMPRTPGAGSAPSGAPSGAPSSPPTAAPRSPF